MDFLGVTRLLLAGMESNDNDAVGAVIKGGGFCLEWHSSSLIVAFTAVCILLGTMRYVQRKSNAVLYKTKLMGNPKRHKCDLPPVRDGDTTLRTKSLLAS